MKHLLIIFFLSSLSLTTFAEDAKSWRASIGVGLGFKRNMRVDNRYKNMDKDVLVKPIPLVQGNIGRFSIGAQGLSVMAIGNQMMNVSAFIKPDGDRYQGYGMGPRKESFFSGISAKFFKYGLSVSKDINGHSKGYLAHFNYGEMFILSESFILRAGVGLEWRDDRYAEYYYGVRPSEVLANRREYHVTNHFVPSINALPIYKVSEKVSLMSGLNLKLIPKSVRNSPTMNGDKLELSGLCGISYSL